MLRRSILVALVLPTVLAGTSSAQSLWVVDDQPSPGTDFTSLQAAVDAAGQGDLLVVRSSTFDEGGLTIANKSISLCLAPGASVEVLGGLTVTGLAPDELVTISSIAFANDEGRALDLRDNRGTVFLDRATIRSEADDIATTEPIRITDCDSVVMVACLMRCTGDGPAGKTALTVRRSVVYEYSSKYFAGDSALQDGASFPGPPAVLLDASRCFFTDSILGGGNGADGPEAVAGGACGAGQAGGPGIRLRNGSRLRYVQPLGLFGGAGGVGGTGCPDGGAGAPLEVDGFSSASVEPISLGTGWFVNDNVVPDGGTSFLQQSGEAQHFGWALLSFEVRPAFVPRLQGLSITAQPAPLGFGQVSSGSASLQLGVQLPAGTAFLRVWSQGLLYSDQDGFVLSNPRLTLIVPDDL